MYDTLQKYAYTMMFINIALILINIAGFFPVANSIAGYSYMENIADQFSTMEDQLASANSTLEYIYVAGLMLIIGIQVLVLFIALVFFGIALIASFIGIPAVIYGPIVIALDCVVLYDFAKMLLRIS